MSIFDYFQEMMVSRMRTRRGPVLPEGPYLWNIKESASHHGIFFCAAARQQGLNYISGGRWNPKMTKNLHFNGFWPNRLEDDFCQ